MTTTTSPTVDDLLADARIAWDKFTTATAAYAPTVAAFAEYRVALAQADALDKQAKDGPYKEAVARYKQIADRVNDANIRIAAALIHDESTATASQQGPVRTRTAEEKREALRDANRDLNALAVEVNAAGYVPRADDDTRMALLPYFAERPHAPSPRRPSSGFELNYGRALDAVLGEYFTAAETAAIADWRQQ